MNCTHEKLDHLVDRPYGLADAYEAGSERFICRNCNHRLSKHEVSERNLKYVYEKNEK